MIRILTSTSIALLFLALVSSCADKSHKEKGFSVSPESERAGDEKIDGIKKDTIPLNTRPLQVLLTGYSNHRLTSIFKVNYNKKKDQYFTGSNSFYRNYLDFGRANGNNWNNNFMPGFAATYGFNMVNISHHEVETQETRLLFNEPVLVRTLYYPSFSKDTLNYIPVERGYYMVSAYDEDTNKDNFINLKDLRRFYQFDLDGKQKTELVPKNYSVIKSEYDSANDFMYIYAQIDSNNNGMSDETEEIHVFWIDLKNPKNRGRHY
jgi:hypothetical protein